MSYWLIIDWLPPVTCRLQRRSSSSRLNCLARLLRLCFSLMALLIVSSPFSNSSWSLWTSALCASTSQLRLAASRLASFSSSSACLRSATCTCSISKGQELEWISDGVVLWPRSHQASCEILPRMHFTLAMKRSLRCVWVTTYYLICIPLLHLLLSMGNLHWNIEINKNTWLPLSYS